jgi:CubicO group peptidase (beta-lactamase class C family)
MPTRIARVLIAIAAGASPLPAQAPKAAPPPPPARSIPELEARIRKVLDSTHTPGVGLTLVSRDSVLYTGGLGLANVAEQRPATGKTLFRIGSTSKAFVSLSVLLLQEEGKLKLSDSIRQYIPEIWFENRWEATDPIRIVNLLEHTTGFDDNSFKGYANNDPTPLTLRQGLELDAATHVSRWRPGTRVSYCNTGPAIAGYILEKIEGKPFERIIQERLFNPLGMTTATYLFPDTARLPVATLYKTDGKTAVRYWHVFIRPAGAINASAEDMAPYVRFLLNRGTVNGTQLLPAAAIERLERTEASLTAASGLKLGYGLHIARYADSAGFVWTGHDGGVEGGLTNMAYIPELGVGYAFMINSGNSDAYLEISRLVRDYLTRDAARPALPPVGPMPAEARAVYAGWYRPDNPRTQHLYFAERLLGLARLRVSDTALALRPLIGGAKAVHRFVPVSGLLFREPREPVATMALISDSANGRPEAIEAMGYLLPTSLSRIPAARAWIEIGVTVLWLAGMLLTLLVAVIGGARWVIRKLRGRTPDPSITRPMWRMAIAAFLALAVGVGLFASMVASNELTIGAASATTVGAWLSLILFALLAAVGVVVTFRRIAATASPRRVSLVAVRTIAILNAIAAGYLIYWGFIGWRTWA